MENLHNICTFERQTGKTVTFLRFWQKLTNIFKVLHAFMAIQANFFKLNFQSANFACKKELTFRRSEVGLSSL